MTHLRSRWTALFLALVLSLSLALPASAAQEDRAQAAHEAAQYAMQYGGAVSVQYALWENGEVTLQGTTASTPRRRTARSPMMTCTASAPSARPIPPPP